MKLDNAFANATYGIRCATLSHMTSRLSLAYFLPLILGLCSCQQLPRLTEQLNTTTVCCQNFKEMRFHETVRSENLNFEIDEQSKVFQFSSGKSPFEAFHLPKEAKGSALKLRTYVAFPWLLTAHFVCPSFIFLDDRFESVREVTSYLLFQKAGSLTAPHHFVVEPIPDTAEYVVIYSQPFEYGRKNQFIGSGGTGVFYPTCGPTGKFELSFK